VALLALADVGDAVRALPVLRALPDLHAVELVLASGTDVVAAHLGLPAPLPPAATCGLLVELAAEGDASTADLVDQLGGALDALGGAIVSTAVAEDDAGQARLWRWREAHSEAAAGLGLVHKADITIPISVTERVIAAIGPAVEAVAPGATTLVYGHLGDGNLHVNVVGPAADDGRAVDAVLELVLAHGGSVSAEHGIGVAKRAWLERQRGSAAVAAMRSIKQALDPDGILNPGVLLP
jgi:FAD/FMN-containing dehydrogenase